MLSQLEYELRLPDVPDPVNKWILGIIVGLGFGSCGLDRCFIGGFTTWALGIGCCKCITGGGCCIWAAADFVVLAYCLLTMSPTINMFWFEARFTTGTIQMGCWTFLGCFAYTLCGSALWRCFAMYRSKSFARRKAGTSWVGPPDRHEVMNIFATFDEDKKGTLSDKELEQALIYLGYPEMEWDNIKEVMDKDEDGKIDIEEFADAFDKEREAMEKAKEKEAKEAKEEEA